MPHSALALHVDGRWVSDGLPTRPVLDPATGTTLGDLPLADAALLDQAAAAAARGYPRWRATSAHERARLLARAADLLRDRVDAIAADLTAEQGKPLAEAREEVRAGADVLQWYAEEGRRAYGRVVPGHTPHERLMIIPEPVGPVAAFTPWNFPVTAAVRKLGGALAAGCSIVLKAAEETPATAIALVRALLDAGVPGDAVGLVFGDPAEVSARLIAHPAIRKISFTGSVPVGRLLARLAADGLKRVTLELGGHAPVLVFADVDPEAVAAEAVSWKFRNAGQVCNSPTRFYVHERVYDRFVAAFVRHASALVVGDGREPGVQVGPLANERRVTACTALVDDAVAQGARLLLGGAPKQRPGFFFPPTVLVDVPPTARILTEEPFGPIVPILPFADRDEVLARANALPFGLASFVFTDSLSTATAVADELEAGMVGINRFRVSTPETPFGGVKESGYGQESGTEGLEPYLVRKAVLQQ